MHRHQAREIAFIYQGNKRNELVTLVSIIVIYTVIVIYINFGKSLEKVTLFGKSSFLGFEPSTMIQNSCNFSPLLKFEFGSIC